MHYEEQLKFLIDTLRKCRIRTLLLPATSTALNHSLRQVLLNTETTAFYAEHLNNAQSRTIYRLADPFSLHYVFLRLPADDRLLFIGPYLTEEIPQEEILEKAEKAGLSPQQSRQLENAYRSVPVLSSYHAVFAMLDSFGELLWGGENTFTVVDINREQNAPPSPLAAHSDSDDTLQNMAMLEMRYAYENELIQAVSQGLTHKAEMLLSGFSQAAFEQRLTDPIRNLKNYCIIMNTLLRKAAEQGGVHPLYLDRASTDFARRIELVSAANDTRELMNDMFHSYCRLVKTHSLRQYSPPVQKIIALIDTDPAGDLSLNSLAKTQGLNASYLSSLFRRETGETVTGHINRKRMQLAMRLLSSTRLQIQTIAQHCGIPDVNYFSKLFKKITGKSPKEYRQSLTPK